jgi:isopentenyldiphosphate isomerase
VGQDELVYHVDKDDVEIGPIPRSAAHRDALYHRAAHVLLLTADDKVILQQRSNDKAIAPGRWTSTASGHVKHGSTYDETAVEELKEETGLSRINLQQLGKLVLVASSGTGHEICRGWTAVYAGRSTGDVSDMRPQAGEVDRFQAFALEEILNAISGEIPLRDAGGKPVLFSTTFTSAISRFAESLRWLG